MTDVIVFCIFKVQGKRVANAKCESPARGGEQKRKTTCILFVIFLCAPLPTRDSRVCSPQVCLRSPEKREKIALVLRPKAQIELNGEKLFYSFQP